MLRGRQRNNDLFLDTGYGRKKQADMDYVSCLLNLSSDLDLDVPFDHPFFANRTQTELIMNSPLTLTAPHHNTLACGVPSEQERTWIASSQPARFPREPRR